MPSATANGTAKPSCLNRHLPGLIGLDNLPFKAQAMPS